MKKTYSSFNLPQKWTYGKSLPLKDLIFFSDFTTVVIFLERNQPNKVFFFFFKENKNYVMDMVNNDCSEIWPK